MEYRNLSPFSSMLYGAFSVHDEEFHAVALRVAYELVPATHASRGRGEALLTHRCAARPRHPFGEIVTADRYEGALNESEVVAESDLAAFKPRCDVIVRATAHAPDGVARSRWLARLRVTASRPRGPSVEIDKTLSVCGPRDFVRHGAGWTLSEPAETPAVPLRWALAWGGRSRVINDEGQTLLDAACFTNPLGTGWIDAGHDEAVVRAGRERVRTVAGPQIEAPDAPVSDVEVSPEVAGITDAAGVARAAAAYQGRPVGLSWLGRAWTPRIQRAGTYDARWLRDRHPFLPEDFSFRYWNAAPDDQQIDFPAAGADIELWNLTAPGVGVGGYVGFELPPHRGFVMAYVAGAPIPVPGRLDTVVVDAEAMMVACVWRVLVPRALRPSKLEARFEMNPAAPLLAFRREA
jgi:hypothetical protein